MADNQDNQANDPLEKLNRGIEESRQMVQQQTMKLAQDFFGDSVEALKGQIQESRGTLEGLPDQIPGGQDTSFQMLFQELMDNFSVIEGVLEAAGKNVADLDPERLRKQAEVNASDAARREAQELGVDLTQVEGSGSGGRIIVSDVIEAVEKPEDGGPRASETVRRRAEELGVDLDQIEGTGSAGIVTLKDVTAQAKGTTEQAAEDAQGAVQEAAGQAQQAAGEADGAVEGAQEAVGQAVGQAGEDDDSGGPKATNAARRKAEELGVDLGQIQGTGAGGLITIKDVIKA